jgi:hypothetical protein
MQLYSDCCYISSKTGEIHITAAAALPDWFLDVWRGASSVAAVAVSCVKTPDGSSPAVFTCFFFYQNRGVALCPVTDR